MGYKKELKQRVSDLLASKKPILEFEYTDRQLSHMPEFVVKNYKKLVRARKTIPTFYIIDSPKEGYFSILMNKEVMPFFMRKSGMYGMIAEKGMCIPVGNARDSISIIQVHIIEQKDCVLTHEELVKELECQAGITTHAVEAKCVPEFELEKDWQEIAPIST